MTGEILVRDIARVARPDIVQRDRAAEIEGGIPRARIGEPRTVVAGRAADMRAREQLGASRDLRRIGRGRHRQGQRVIDIRLDRREQRGLRGRIEAATCSVLMVCQ